MGDDRHVDTLYSNWGCVCVCVSYRAVRLYIRSFQSDGDAVEEDENQNHVVEHFVRDHTLAPHTASKHTHTHTHRVIYKMSMVG